MRVLVAPQEFKGSLTAQAATRAVEIGVRRATADVDVVLAPMADGGPGTLELLREALGGELVAGTYRGPLGSPVDASWVLLPAQAGAPMTAVIEAATTAGLLLVPSAERTPAAASTFGVGQQIASALARGARRIIVGVGGTGTNDGGAGAAQALGFRLLDGRGKDLPPGPLALHWLSRIERPTDSALLGVEVVVAADVTNALLGPGGATAVFGPQKGVNRVHGARIEAALKHWAAICRRDLGVDIEGLNGGGAGGGLAAGLVVACGARIESGAAVVADAIGLRSRIEQCDVVITGEGRLDAQTAGGKTVSYVAALAAELGRPCYAIVGSVDAPPPAIAGLTGIEVAGGTYSEAEALARATELLEAAAERLGGRIAAGSGAGTPVSIGSTIHD